MLFVIIFIHASQSSVSLLAFVGSWSCYNIWSEGWGGVGWGLQGARPSVTMLAEGAEGPQTLLSASPLFFSEISHPAPGWPGVKEVQQASISFNRLLKGERGSSALAEVSSSTFCLQGMGVLSCCCVSLLCVACMFLALRTSNMYLFVLACFVC